MGITVRWQDEQAGVIRWQYEGQWTQQDFAAAFEQEGQMVQRHRPHSIQAIFDLTCSTALMIDWARWVGQYAGQTPSQIKRTIVISRSGYLRLMYRLYAKVYPKDAALIVIVKSEDEARRLLDSHRDA